MYNLKTDLAQKKKKQAIRRLSQGGKRPTYSSFRGRGGGTTSRGRTRPRLKSQENDKTKKENPFVQQAHSVEAPPPSTSTDSQNMSQAEANPFFAAMSKSTRAVSVANRGRKPPSYAAMVSGPDRGRGQRTAQPRPPVPSFITHGPHSVSVSSSETSTSVNPFLAEPSQFHNPFTDSGSTNMPSNEQSITVHYDPSRMEQPPGSFHQTPLNTEGFDSTVNQLPQLPSYSDSLNQYTEYHHPSLQQMYESQALFTQASSLREAAQMMLEPQPLPHSSNATLHIKGIPDELNNPIFLKKHFSRFGPVKDIKCNPNKLYATVEFEMREAAVLAKKSGKKLRPEYNPVQIFWHSGGGSNESRSTATTQLHNQTYMLSDNTQSITTTTTNTQQWQQPLIEATNSNQTRRLSSSLQHLATTTTTREETIQPAIKPVVSRTKRPSRIVTQQTVTAPTGIAQSSEQIHGVSLKRSIQDRLGPAERKKKTRKQVDDEWCPDDGGPDGVEEEGEGDEGVFEGRDFISELGNKSTGNEMDTIAKTVQHPYYLRSMDQPEVSNSSQQTSTVREESNSRSTYDIPSSNLPPPPLPRGNSALDFYDALNARDQEIRKGIVKQTTLTDARVIVGTCPDMCPEKERFIREETRRLSWFEVTADSVPGAARVDHARAVKEYSGSAADKEEPLPHELRPLGVLCMTMDYLVTMVMDAGSDRPADWYDFLWNRTRAIRKDITIQHLSAYECVELTEKCARFHILCSHLLCEESMRSFNPKLNNDNLNKCLLSLKQFYRDLRHQQGLQCPNEAEFCCYDILLHLTEGDVLTIHTQYSDSIQQSEQVKFAVKVALVFNSDNFIRFFKLVKSGSFLCACLMHRYFTLVRSKALSALNRAYSLAKTPTQFPLATLVRMLAFGDTTQASEFCRPFGLGVVGSDVVFVRKGMVEPEEPIPIQRSYHLVTQKNKKLLGEVVNGGPLPATPKHKPYSSFSAEAMERKPRTREPTPLPEVKPCYTDEDFTSVVSVVINEVVGTDLKTLVEECIQQENEQQALIKATSSFMCNELMNECIQQECFEIVEAVLTEALDISQVKDELSQSVVAEVLDSGVSLELVLVTREVYRDCVVQAQAADSAVHFVTDDLMERGVGRELRGVVEETLKELIQERREKLEGLRRQVVIERQRKYWARWRHMLKVRQHVQECISGIPPLPPLIPLPQQLEILLPLEKRQRIDTMALEQEGEIRRQLEASMKERERKRKELYCPLNIPSLLRESLLSSRMPEGITHPHRHHLTPHIYWKLAFLFPATHEMTPTDTMTVHWLHQKLKFQDKSTTSERTALCEFSDDVIQSLSTSSAPLDLVEEETTGPSTHRLLHVAIKSASNKMRLVDSSVLRNEFLGTAAMMLYVPTPVQRVAEEALIEYILELVNVVVGPCQGVPLLIMYSQDLEENHLALLLKTRMSLNSYLKDSFISEIHWLKIKTPDTLSPHPVQQMCSGLRWLAEHSSPQPSLFHLPVKEFIEMGLLEHFVPLVVSDRDNRSKLHLPSQPPAPIIILYNAVIEYLVSMATSSELKTTNWPVSEFAPQNFSHRVLPPLNWNSSDHLSTVYKCMTSLYLPSPPQLHVHHDHDQMDWSKQCEQCLDYVSGITLPQWGEITSSIPLLSRIKSLLHLHHRKLEGADPFDNPHVPWDQVVLACTDHMLSHLHSRDLWVSGILYSEAARMKFSIPTRWMQAQVETSLSSVERPSSFRKRHRRYRSDPPLLPISYHTPSSGSLSVGVSPAVGHCGSAARNEENIDENKLKRKLEMSIQNEKALSQSFEAQLQQWLSAPSLDNELTQSMAVAACSSDTEESWDDSSVTRGLEQLRKKIRLTRWQDARDNIQLHSLVNTSKHSSYVL